MEENTNKKQEKTKKEAAQKQVSSYVCLSPQTEYLLLKNFSFPPLLHSVLFPR